MGRLVLAAILGAAVGIAGAVYLGNAPDDELTLASGIDAGPIEAAHLDTLLDRPLGVADRAAVFEFASRAARPALTASIDAIARQPSSPERKFLIGALLARITEDDAYAALEVLRELGLDPSTTRALALQVAAAMGTSEGTLTAVASALPQIDQRRLRLEAITALADGDPDGALALALATNEELRNDAVRAVANAWAEKNPLTALALADSIVDEDLKLVFVDRVLREMARTDLRGAVAFVNERYAAGDREHPRLMQALMQEGLQQDPTVALGVAQQIGGRFGENLQMQAIGRWARDDPLAAFAYVQALPPGGQRQNLQVTIAQAYGQRDPDAALAWARSLDPLAGDMLEAVIGGIARADPLRAIDLAEARGPSPRNRYNYFGGGGFRLVMGALQNTATPRVPAAAIGDRLLAVDPPEQRDEMLRMFLDRWSDQDADAALEWLFVNSERVPSSAYRQVAGKMGQNHPSEALRHLNRLPPERRAEWAGAAVWSMAQRDPVGAVQWVAELRGQPIYDASVTAVIQIVSQSNAEHALTLFDTLGPEAQADAAKDVGTAWGQQDMPAARDWIVRMQAGPVRDAALAGLIGGMRESVPDAATLALFSADGARQDALLQILPGLAYRDQAAALELADRYITDPTLRQRAGLALTRASR